MPLWQWEEVQKMLRSLTKRERPEASSTANQAAQWMSQLRKLSRLVSQLASRVSNLALALGFDQLAFRSLLSARVQPEERALAVRSL